MGCCQSRLIDMEPLGRGRQEEEWPGRRGRREKAWPGRREEVWPGGRGSLWWAGWSAVWLLLLSLPASSEVIRYDGDVNIGESTHAVFVRGFQATTVQEQKSFAVNPCFCPPLEL